MTASLMVTVASGDHQDSESLVIIPMEDDITIYKISGEGVIYSAGGRTLNALCESTVSRCAARDGTITALEY